ncbi:YopX family protein [Parablautia sp. Marseille-Q6255]|uniref:YopX family protein n=1 Tax=Parablautia sp. Marseille-Q6255 TaxID=3039593 RepID=UPI0024BC4A72|nr:YopX family protein [Parablautia sp. Marseille-Q6255]
MREILFKAKRIDNGEWVEGDLLHTIHPEIVIISDFEDKAYRCDGNTICQYTGLNDKNGQKIWENDICTIRDGTIDEEDGRFICEWDNDAARFVLSGNSLTVDFDNVYTTDVEVCGNIFDNADLLGEDEDEQRN